MLPNIAMLRCDQLSLEITLSAFWVRTQLHSQSLLETTEVTQNICWHFWLFAVTWKDKNKISRVLNNPL